MMTSNLSKNEKQVLWGLVAFPDLNDMELAEKLEMHYSTFCTIRKRLQDGSYYRTIRIPVLQMLGAEMLAVIYTVFNPAISVQERAKITTKTIEISEELFYSVGETHKGFSVSMASEYAEICRINDIRIETFAKAGLLDQKHPTEAIFPFKISHIPRFFDYASLLASVLGIDEKQAPATGLTSETANADLTAIEKQVLLGLVENPDMNEKELAEKLDLSRHTFSRAKKHLESEGMIIKKRIPNLLKLGFKVLAISHIKFNPRKPFDEQLLSIGILQNPATFLLAARKFECITLSAYMEYEDYREEHTRDLQYLKENDYLLDMPNTAKYMIPSMVVMKDMVFGPMVKKTLELK
jgi:DNA-binding Lrp family transcriptional regulator